MTLNPKKRFLEQPNRVKAHADLIDRSDVVESLQTALAEMVVEQSGRADAPTAMAQHYRLEGAKELIHTFINLSTPETQRERPATDQLNYGDQKRKSANHSLINPTTKP